MKLRGGKGFRRAGSVGAGALGLPKPLVRKLELEHAWQRIAGPALARRVRAAQIRNGVVELAVDDARWAREVIPLLPTLAGRLVRAAPGLGVRKFRITVGGEVRSAPAVPPDDVGLGDGSIAAAEQFRTLPERGEIPARCAPAIPAPAPSLDAELAVAQLARRYLAAVSRRRG